MKQLTELNSWIELENHVQSLRLTTINDLNATDTRSSSLTASTTNIKLDFSNQRVNSTTLELLFRLAHECDLKNKIDALMRGDFVNNSEVRPALHTALRALDDTPIMVNNHDVIPDIFAAREKIKTISDAIRAKEWLGFSGKPIKDIVNIGMGGSDLGPRFTIRAFADIAAEHLRYHFVSDVDPNALNNAVKRLNPETTLFIVSSKSFTTKETLHNAKKALSWLNQPASMDNHFIAITANVKKANELGFNNVLPIWDWVGGRYSLCSAISLITAIAIGYEQFMQMLAGAHSMDKHFQETDFERNLPALLGLLGIWNNNFLHIHNLLLLVYSQQLEYLVPYIQQLDMESNGKSIDKRGRAVNHATGPLVWGGLGNQAQHSYYQLLCQGTHKVTLDFITIQPFEAELINKMSEAKRHILAHGVHDNSNPNGYIPGNKPLNHIQLKDCSPFTLGQLIALYEHKIYTQSVIWDINAFDQPGVESAKRHGAPSVVS